jgi:hypothetical protein
MRIGSNYPPIFLFLEFAQFGRIDETPIIRYTLV